MAGCPATVAVSPCPMPRASVEVCRPAAAPPSAGILRIAVVPAPVRARTFCTGGAAATRSAVRRRELV
nr:hypothetical protein DA06_03225 [Georgenia sp. SUBG003]